MLGDGAMLDWPGAIIPFEAARHRALRPRARLADPLAGAVPE